MTLSQTLPFLKDLNGQEHPLDSQGTRIGRAVENDIVIVSKRVSREHARIWREGRYWYLEDLGSTNGTFLNDERVQGEQRLRDGDLVVIGEARLAFNDPDTTTAETPLPVLEVNRSAGMVRLDRRAVELSPKEFLLLAYLYERRGQVCSKDEIGRAVWSEYQSGVYDYQIENLVRRLRTRIEPDPANPQLMVTVRGLGYRLVLE